MRTMVNFGAVILFLAASRLGASPAEARQATPAATCQVAPRPAGFFDQIAATPGATKATPVGTPAGSASPVALPQGQPADQATVAAVSEVERQLVACLNAGDYARAYALYTDDYLRRNLTAATI